MGASATRTSSWAARELIDAIAVGVTADVVTGGVTRQNVLETKADGSASSVSLGTEGVALILRPGIQLQLYF